MKTVILAAGLGSRLSPITKFIPKPMISLAGKPIIQYIIEDLTSFGISDIGIVVGYKEDIIKKFFKTEKKLSENITFISQKTISGTGNALLSAKDYVDGKNFLLYLSDTLINNDLNHYLKIMVSGDSDIELLSARLSSSKIKQLGGIVEKNGHVTEIAEKNPSLNTNLGWAGVALFRTNTIFDVLENLSKFTTGGYEITNAMNLLAKKKSIKNHICNGFIDSGSITGLLNTCRFILDNKHKCCNNISNELTQFIPPLHIGKNCYFGTNVTIGPYVTIGDSVTIGNNVKVKNSIIMANSCLSDDQSLKNVIVHDNTILH